ncbi:ABC transporter permease [Aliiroseovarius sp. Z3]|uniref:ABC transporter permease n=1 Tax=Aliiroseovarius sp. Z3 TaxID=2811402 RepID=UPI0023B2F741|nr:ABC transporter permease [Aliiroseovarius sp. Z3]MDE9450054.1 ABC transporter permease [Aliiroseovarius sp. Z3]
MQGNKGHISDTGVVALSLSSLVAMWALAAWMMADPTVLPTPMAVLRIMWDQTLSGALPYHLAATLGRVLIAFFLAMVIGMALGITLGLSPRLNRWVNPWIVVFLNVPALVVIVLCYLWLGLNEVAALIAVSVNKTAMVVVMLREGTQNLSRPIGEMAQVFKMRRLTILRHVILPQLAPYISASARNGLAVIWKIVLVVEFLGRGNGIGFQIHMYFQLFETGYVMAYSLSFVAVMLLIEYAILVPLEGRSRRPFSAKTSVAQT